MEGKSVGIIALDVQKAFDSVNHPILCTKLGLMGVDSSWFTSYLFNRKQVVCINGITSESLAVSHGVPQGSILGPLLYLSYTTDPYGISDTVQITLIYMQMMP